MNFLAFCQLFGVMSRSRLQERLKLLYILHVKKLTNRVAAPDQVTREDKMKKQDIEGKTTKVPPFQHKKPHFNFYAKLLPTVSPATSKPEESCERTEDAEEPHEPCCDTELAEDKMNTKSEELNPAGMEGREK